MSKAPVEVWRGSVNSWECDHLGHLNTRYYITRVEEGLAGLAAALGVSAPLTVRAQHMRFITEARPGAALFATGQVLAWRERDAELLIILRHAATDAVAATFRLRVEPNASWSTEAIARANDLTVPAPAEALPRSLSLDDQTVQASLQAAERLGLRRTGLGAILPHACDARGAWRLSELMGRIADSVPHLSSGDWRSLLEQTAPGAPLRVGSALVEFQTVHVRWPRAGDRCEVRSGLAGCSDRVTYSAHWLVDPETGNPWASVKTVGIPLDLDARRPIRLTPEAQAAYRALSVDGLSL